MTPGRLPVLVLDQELPAATTILAAGLGLASRRPIHHLIEFNLLRTSACSEPNCFAS